MWVWQEVELLSTGRGLEEEDSGGSAEILCDRKTNPLIAGREYALDKIWVPGVQCGRFEEARDLQSGGTSGMRIRLFSLGNWALSYGKWTYKNCVCIELKRCIVMRIQDFQATL